MNVYRLITTDSVEEGMLQTQDKKNTLAQSALSGGVMMAMDNDKEGRDNNNNKLSIEDLASFFQ